jgi:serine/threonine protein kinase/tetratricopeptide (TPR) repeat protein
MQPKSIDRIFWEAAKLRSAEERDAYLEQACGGDSALRQRVEQFLQARSKAENFLESPPPVLAATVDEPLTERPGTVIGPYKLLEQIGEGGMGLVFVAEQLQPLRRKVAVKIVKPGMDSKQVLARFEAERQALALMDHPHIAKVLDAGSTAAGRPYFVMELVHGIPLTDYCDQARLSIPERLRLFIPVCRAVQHAHQKGIIHRDLKPSNVLVSSHDGVPVPQVIDFGVAKALAQPLTERTLHTGYAQLVGTPLYMSPEQAEFNPHGVDTRSDVYSLGVVLYELLTGTTPFAQEQLHGAGFEELRRLLRDEEPPRPSARLSTLGAEACTTVSQRRGVDGRRLGQLLHGELDWIVMKTLEKDRNRRYESASALAADVQRYLDDEPVQACPPSTAYRVRKFVRRHKGPVVAAALVLLTLAVGIIGTTWGMVRAQAAAAERQKAEQLAERDRDAASAAEADTSAFSDFLVTHVLAVARPKGVQGGLGIDVTVAQALEAAEGSLQEVFTGRPKAEATARHALGVTCRNLGRYTKAVEHLQRAKELREQELGPDAEETLASGNSLAVALLAAGQIQDGLLLHEQVLEKQKATLGLDHPDTLRNMASFAAAYGAAGRVHEALVLHEQVLEKQKATLGPDHPDTLQSMDHLALAQDSVVLQEQVVERRKAILGPDHNDTLESVRNLARVYGSAGRMPEAVSLYEQVLAKRRATLGPDHPETVSSINDLGFAYFYSGRLQEAAALHQQALEKHRATLGPDHPSTLASMNNLAVAYGNLGRLQDAVVLQEHVLEKEKAMLGPDHPDTILSMKNLAYAYLKLGRWQDAIALFEQTLEKRKAKFGLKHGGTLLSMQDLADAYLASGRSQDAMALFEQTLEKTKAALGTDHGLTLDCMLKLARVYQDTQKLDQADRLLREVLELRRKKKGPKSEETAGVLSLLGLNLLQQQQYSEAEPLLRECLALREHQLPDCWLRYNTLSLLGGALLGQQQYAAAEPLLLQGYEGMKQREAKIPPNGSLRLTQAVERLVRLYEATNQPDKARLWRERLPNNKRRSD